MEGLIQMIIGRWGISFAGFAIISALVWFFAPLIPGMQPWYMRLGLIVILLLLWFIINALISWRRGKNEKALLQGVAGTGKADKTADASAEEAAAMSEKLAEALALLKKASGNRGYLYERPWYAIIGPPGAGKTTALVNAGLKFPLAGQMGQNAVAGVGGTRMCEWWFAEDAVLIDTAGRYTTQDSDAAVDKAGWDAFLAMLKRTRARQPLNGVIVAISMTDIAAAPHDERMAHARAIRSRVKELTDKLGVKLPVYALFTKADLIVGFTEFFDDLVPDAERRGQVWGMTFPLDTRGTGSSGLFGAEYALLVEQLNRRLIDRLQNERSTERRTAIAGFPAQFASLKAPLAEFIEEAFGGSRLDPAPLLRGVYIASGTQEGTPIDRLTAAISRSFGIDQRRAALLRPVQGRSYFLTRLLRDVVFGEATLVSRDPAKARRALVWRIVGMSLAMLILLAGAAAIVQTRAVNNQAVLDSETALAAYIEATKTLTLDPINESSLTKVVPVLDKARALPFGPDAPPPVRQWFPGLSQTEKLAFGAKQIYTHALGYILLPRLVHRLEAQMRQRADDQAFLYEATRIYMMLGSKAKTTNIAAIKEWMHFDWETTYPGPTLAPFRQRLELHLATLLSEPLPPIDLDEPLLTQAQATFANISLSKRVYSAIRQSAEATGMPPWSPADVTGPNASQVFYRKSGVPFPTGIPGFFTVDGFHKVLLPRIPDAIVQVANDSWVLGPRAQVAPDSTAAADLQKEVVKLYTDDYATQWDALLADIEIVRPTDIQDAQQKLYALGSQQSPMKELLAGIVRQLTLTVPPPLPPGTPPPTGGANPAAPSRLQTLLANPSGPPPEPPGKVIEDRYKPLIAVIGKGPGAPIDTVLKLLSDLQNQLAQVATGAAGAATSVNVAQLIQNDANNEPQPLQRWLLVLAVSGNAQRSSGVQQAAVQAFKAPGGPGSLCKLAVDGRYPFAPGATDEIPLDDFARLFAPNGMLDTFYTAQIAKFVDTSATVWKLQPSGGVQPPLKEPDLAQFQRASKIRDLFFASGGAQPSVRFDITPQTVDVGAKQVTMDLDGLTITYAHGPLRATSVTWPGGAQRINNARLVFDPPPSSGPPVLEARGPWALFRLFGMGRLTQSGSADRYLLTFQLGDREASFEIRAGSVLNPFAPGILGGFRCPTL